MDDLAKQVRSPGLILPEVAFARNGVEFYPQSDVWRIDNMTRQSVFDYRGLRDILTDDMQGSLKSTMLWYVENKSTVHACNVMYHFVNLVKWLYHEKLSCVDEVSAIDVQNYRSTLNVKHHYYITVIIGLLKQWFDLGFSGISSSSLKVLSQLRLPGNLTGRAVRTWDPHQGPFTEIELQSLYDALHASYGMKKIGLKRYVLACIFMALGIRPVQAACLKCCDLNVERSNDGILSYMLKVPRAKQRSLLHRKEFKERFLTQELGELLELWIQELKEVFKQTINDATPLGELPIFPDWKKAEIPDFSYHSSSLQLGRLLVRVCQKLQVYSSRVGGNMHVSPRRYRYTLGTRLAEEGHSEFVIAECLDHSDTQNVGVYTAVTSKMIDRIDAAMASRMGPYSQLFKGEVVEEEFAAIRGDDANSRVGAPGVGNVGSCGTYGHCEAYAPLACYVCHNFQPWVDAPHEELLEHLLAERDRIFAESGDERMAAVNDRVILAISQVLKLCSDMKQEVSNG